MFRYQLSNTLKMAGNIKISYTDIQFFDGNILFRTQIQTVLYFLIKLNLLLKIDLFLD